MKITSIAMVINRNLILLYQLTIIILSGSYFREQEQLTISIRKRRVHFHPEKTFIDFLIFFQCFD